MINRKRLSDHRPSPLLGRWAMAAYSLALAYGGGLWLHLLHEAEGATEQNAPHTIIHWLRDSTLALPLIAFGVFLATHLARRLLARYGADASRLTTSALIAAVVSLYAAVVVAVGNPLHAALFGGEHGGHDLPVWAHLVRDGLLALTADLVIAAGLLTFVASRRWLTSRFMEVRSVAARSAFSVMMALGAMLGGMTPAVQPVVANAATTTDSTNTCPSSAPVNFNITAINITMPLNRFGDHDSSAHMYALNSKIGNATTAGTIRYQEAMFNNPATQADSVSLGLNGFPVMQADGTAKVVEDAIQPLAIRANGGDCVVVNFTNGLGSGTVGMHIDGLNFQMSSSADSDGKNSPSGVAAGATARYTYFIPNDPALEGSHYVHPGASNRALVNHGLFGTLTVEAPGSTYIKPDGTPITDPTNDSDWERTIVPGAGTAAGPGVTNPWCQTPASTPTPGACAPFRENIKVHQDIGNESEPILDKNNNALPTVDPHTHAYRPGSRGLNYRSEPFMDRLNLNPDQKSQTYGSYTFSDPATIVPRGYQGDPTKFRIVHAGSEVFHVYHLHGGAIRWRFNPRADMTWDYSKTGLDKHPQVENAQSFQLDAQEIGPGESYNLEIEGGAGTNQYGAGEFLFHCHIAEHYFSGMWGFWRVFDTAQPDLAALPGKLKPADAITSDQLIGKTFNGQTITTAADLENWIRPQLPAQGVKQLTVNTVGNGSFSQDGSVLDWVIDPATGVYLGEKENTSSWVDLPRLGNSSTAASGGGSSVPALAGHPGSMIADRTWFGAHPTSNRPAILFNPTNGRPAFPLLRAHPGDRPPFAPNGHSGAPYLGETNKPTTPGVIDPYAGRSDAICPTNPATGQTNQGAQIRHNNIVAVPLVIPHTEAAAKALAANPALADPINFTTAWSQNIDQKGGIFLLAQNKDAVKASAAHPTGAPGIGPDGAEKPIEPLALRANVGDCLFNTLTSEEKDGDPELPYAKANIHIHHVQFDTQASDGVISGFSFDQSVRPYQIEDTRLTADATGASVLHVASVAKFLNPDGSPRNRQTIAVSQGTDTLEIRIIKAVDPVALTLTLDSPLTRSHPAGDWAGNEFVQYMWYPDIALDNIFYHDHVNGVFGWSHGFVGQLVIEPRGATYYNPKDATRSRELSSGTQADVICLPTNGCNVGLAPGQIDGSYREQVIWNIDNHSTSTPAEAKIFLPAENSINLRSEPWSDRLADNSDPALLFSSYAHGDPYTPMPRAYLGDNVVIRAVNVSQNVNDLQIDGHRFSTEPRMTGQTKTIVDPQTGISKLVTAGPNIAAKLDTYHDGISERVTLILEGGAGGLQKKAGDYLYHDGLGSAFRNGAWGLLRVLDGNVTDLQPLPGNAPALAAPTTLGVQGQAVPATTDPGNPCPTAAAANPHKFAITAVKVPNAPVGGQNAFVDNTLAAAVKAGTVAPEPLALHVSAGECVEVTLTNDNSSGLNNVSFNVGRVVSDPKSSGINAGFSSQQGVAPGASRVYRYYVDSDRIGSAAIAGFGGSATLAAIGADAARNGLYGALVSAPAGSTFTDPISGKAKDIGTQVDVHTADGKGYRDFSLMLMETDPQIGTSHMPYPISVSGPALVNYQSAQGWNANPRPDDANTFSSATYGDPKTPILQAYQGDPTRVHVIGAPGSEQMHVVNLGSMSFPLDPNLVGINDPNAANNKMAQNYTASTIKLQNRAVGAFETLDAYLDGGMGGPGAVKGDFVYQDRRLAYTQAGMWGLLRSLDRNLCTNLQSLPGLPCAAGIVDITVPPSTIAPATPGVPAQQGFAAPTPLTPPTPNTAANLANWTIPVQLSWAPSTTGTVDHYELQATASTSTNLLTWSAANGLPAQAGFTATVPATTVNLAVGKMTTGGISLNKYSFQVRACGDATTNLCSAFSSFSPTFTLIPVDDLIVGPLLNGAGSIGYSGNWTTKSMPGVAYGGTVHASTAPGANALLQNVSFTVSGDVAWVSTLGPNMGIATVQVDNGPVQTLDLYSSTVKGAQVVWQTAGLTAGVQHKVTIKVTGTKNAASTGTEVDVDAFIVLR